MLEHELLWRQIADINEYLRFVAEQGLAWFVFGVGANAAAAWAILADNITLRTKIVPVVLIGADIFGALVCIVLPLVYYSPANAELKSLMRTLSAKHPAFHAAPAFPLHIWWATSWCMAGLLVVLAMAWFIALNRGALIGRKTR